MLKVKKAKGKGFWGKEVFQIKKKIVKFCQVFDPEIEDCL